MISRWRSSSGSKIEATERLPMYGPLEIEDLKNYYYASKKRFSNLYQKPCPYIAKRDDFEILYLLGKGAFGVVMLVKDKKSERHYAMKALQKKHIAKMRQIAHALNEKRILQCIDFPFGVRMEYFSKDNSYIYFFMPFVSGGEMFTHLQRMGKFNEQVSRFYAAQVVLGLEYLHYLSLAYRDLKPENLLIDHHGYLKITDFGFTKPVATRTYTFCGTPHYLAPEIITGHGYGLSVDWWALGVLIFEMNAGYPPYDARDQMIMFKLILQNRYVLPSYFTPALKDLVGKLLQVDTTKRYGNLRNKADDIKTHDWFKPVDWMVVLNRRVDPPFIPATEGQGDISHYPTTGDEASIKVSTDNQFDDEFKDF